MIGEPKPQGSTDTSDKNQYEANAARLAEISTKNVGELSDDELETMLAERKTLRSAQSENIGRAQEEATAENAERDAETARKAVEAKAAEDAARAEQAAAHAAKEAEDAAKATALAEQIKSGNIGGEAKPAEKISDAETATISTMLKFAQLARRGDPKAREDYYSTWNALPLEMKTKPGFKDRFETAMKGDRKQERGVAYEEALVEDAERTKEKEGISDEVKPMEIAQEDIIEKIGAPKTEMFEKYGERMRNSSSELVTIVKTMQKKWDEMVAAGGAQKNPKLWEEHRALNEKRNKLRGDAMSGVDFRRKKTNETYDEYWDYQRKAMQEYRNTAMQDPQTILNMAASGELGNGYRDNEGIGQIDGKLRRNPEFMKKVLETLSRDGAESFYVHVRGGTPEHKALYIASIRKNHLNYQWGSKEWATDPEVQKIALESGLDPMYLQKN
jgi:hypothetical protein